MPRCKLYRCFVPVCAKSTYYGLGFVTEIAVVPKRFPSVHVADVHFHERYFHAE